MAIIVLDTSVIIRLVLPSQIDPRAQMLWEQCVAAQHQIVLPSQALSETMAIIRGQVYRSRLTAVAGEAVFSAFRALLTQTQIETSELGAWEIAKRYNRPNTYDSEFYSQAERLAGEFWTADDRLVNSMGTRKPTWVHRLSEIQ